MSAGEERWAAPEQRAATQHERPQAEEKEASFRRELEARVRSICARVSKDMSELEHVASLIPECATYCGEPPSYPETPPTMEMLPTLSEATDGDAPGPRLALEDPWALHARAPLESGAPAPHAVPAAASEATPARTEARKASEHSVGSRADDTIPPRQQRFSDMASDDDFRTETTPLPKVDSRASQRVTEYMGARQELPAFFEAFFGAAILTNALFSGVEVQWKADHIGEHLPLAFPIVRHAYTLLFLVELLARLGRNGVRDMFYRSEDRGWAWLDLTVVVSGLVEMVFDAALFFDTGDVRSSAGPVSKARLVRMLRVLRAVRLQRIVRFVSALRTLVYSITATLRSLFWAMVLLLGIVYVFGMTFTMEAVDLMEAAAAEGRSSPDVLESWGSLGRSMFTLYMSISGGVSWNDPLQPLQGESGIAQLLFSIYIAFTYFAVLNVVTGVFCSSALDTAQRNPAIVAKRIVDERVEASRMLRKMFGALDSDDQGQLTVQAFKMISRDDMVRAYFEVLGIDFHDVHTLFRLVDVHNRGWINVEDFIMGCEQLRGKATNVHIAEVHTMMDKINNRVKRLVAAVEQMHSVINSPGA